jgi:hypothetical protein
MLYIGSTGAAANTTAVTLSDSSILRNMNITVTSTGHFRLIGVLISTAASSNSVIDGCKIVIDNSTATVGGSSNAYGVYVNPITAGSNYAFDNFYGIKNCYINVTTRGFGQKRACFLSPLSYCGILNSSLFCGSTGTGPFNGQSIALSASTGSTCMVNCSTLIGSNFDFDGETGCNSELYYTALYNNAAASGDFSSYPVDQLYYSFNGTPAAGTLYFFPGNNTTTNVLDLPFNKRAILLRMDVTCTVGPVGGNDTFSIFKSGVIVSTAVMLAGNVSTSSAITAISFSGTDSIRVQQTSTAATKGRFPVIALRFYS